MAKKGKKQSGKSAAKQPASFSKSATAKKPVVKKSTAKKTTARKTTAKQTATKEAVVKKTDSTKKTTKAPQEIKAVKETKISQETKAVEEPKAPQDTKATQKTQDFNEFETLKIEPTDKLDSKIILRDVTREKIIERIEFKPDTKPAIEPKINDYADLKFKDPEPLPVFHPVSRPRPVENPVKIPAKELKDQAIEKAIRTATKVPTEKTRRKRNVFGEFGWTRVVLAAACITTAIFAVVYFVNLTSSNMSLQVAATQSGIDAKYPSYVPRGFELSDVTSSSGKVSMHFKGENGEFGLSEETSSWDSEGLLNNFIKPTYGNDYVVVREQGLTLYMGTNWQAWVNGGLLYKIDVISGSFTKKQLKAIATSL